MPFQPDGTANVLIGPLALDLPTGTMRPNEIKLWPENPRISLHLTRLDRPPTEEDLIAAIRDSGQQVYKQLRHDIALYGQSVPVFVKAMHREGSEVHTAMVFEGATRVSILKELHQRDPRDSKFAHVKVYLLPDSFSDRDLAVLLANYHVKRASLRNPWTRFQIGAFLYNEIEKTGRFTGAQMAEQMGMSAPWVSRHLTIYRLALEYRDFLESEEHMSRPESEVEAADRLSLLEEAYKVKAFRDRWEYDDEAKPTLFKWILAKKFTDHRKIRAIEQVYANEHIRREVEQGDKEAGDAVATRMVAAHPLHEDLDRITRRAKEISVAELDAVDPQRLDNAIAALQRLRATVQMVRQ